ncbi:MAG: contractile injection system tape measure protein [Aestuariivirga sp.]
MTAQQHKIMRQVLEVRGCPPEAAWRMQAELRGACYNRLLPVIDKVCTELATPGRIYRIHKLEIDLGTSALEALESSMAGRFEAAFSRQLADAIGAAPQNDSALELFNYFIATGTVPWWAERLDRGLLEANLEDLMRRAPRLLRGAVGAARDPERMLRRIARAYPDRLLDELTAIMAPVLSGPGSPAQWIAGLESVSRARGHSPRAARSLWWEEVLRAAGGGDRAISGAPGLFRLILARMARHLETDYRALLADLRLAYGDGAVPVQPGPRDTTEMLWREHPAGSPSPGLPTYDGLMQGLARLEQMLMPQAEMWARLRQVLDRLPARLSSQAGAAFAFARGSEMLNGATIDALTALLRAALEENLLAPGLVEHHGRLIQQSAPPGLSAAESSALGAKLLDVIEELDVLGEGASAREEGPPATSSFSDAGELYVENSGLVILWPFLESFFKRLGLIEEKRFKDKAAAMRAAGLLQYIASADESPPEFLLPLNKVLCGIAPEEVFDYGAEITAAEIEECNDMLAAVIEHAPILRGMSPAGFRGSFLLRKGQLGTRDGNWLLCVERLTHDIVLDRFPWNFGIVRLPWMETMMQVEW